MPVALGGFIFGVIFLAVPEMYKWEEWQMITCLVVNMLLNLWSWYLIGRFGLGNLDGIKFTGNYMVGHKTIYAKKFGSPVSVWYPIDQGPYKGIARKRYMEGGKHALENLTAIGKGAAWLARTDAADTGPFMLKHILSIVTQAIPDAQLANDYMSGENKLIPIVFSHGILANREDYQLRGMELASNGYIVFMCDHLDGLGRYVKMEGDEAKIISKDFVHPSDCWPKDEPDNEKCAAVWYKDVHQKRIEEISEIINDMEEEMFMSNRLHFGKAQMDLDKIVMCGHSLGGATALGVGEQEDRVKLVLSLDPHGNILKDTIGSWTKIHKKPLQVQWTEQMSNIEPRNIAIHGPGIYDKMENPDTFENLMLYKTDHMHQGDMMAIMPLELNSLMLDARFKEEKMFFDPRKRELDLYFTHLQMRFMRK